MKNYKPDFESLPQLVCEYLMYIDVIKNRSQKTIFEYSINLREFITFLVSNKNNLSVNEFVDIRNCDESFFKSVSLNDAYQYLSYCKNSKNNNPTTRNRKVVVIRQFFKYLTDNKHILSENPMKMLDTAKKEKKLPKYLTLEQSLDLLSSVDGKNMERDYAILTLFLNCGLRLSELVSINYKDIRSDNTLRVYGKGAKERTVYLNQACVSAVTRYMNVRPKDAVKDREALFLSNRLTRISPRTVQYIVETFLDKSGLGEMGFSVHKLRHTAATLMYQHGNVDVLVLKDILGHENLNTTEIYTHLANEQVQSAIENNPLANVQSKDKKS